MAIVEIKDFVIWAKHIHGDKTLREHLLALNEGDPVTLLVDGTKGVWVKMDDGRNGVPTPGIKPVGPAKRQLAELYRAKKGEIVQISLA